MAPIPNPNPTPWQPPQYGGVAPYTNASNQTPSQGGNPPTYAGLDINPFGTNNASLYQVPYDNNAALNTGTTPSPNPTNPNPTNPNPNNNNNNRNNNAPPVQTPDTNWVPPGWSRTDMTEGATYIDTNGNHFKYINGAWQQQGNGPDMNAINDVYQPTMNYLNQAESAVRADFPNVLDAAQKQYETAISELQGGKQKNMTMIGENQITATNQKEDALSAARRLYDELRRGYQQRFGGSTSAGQAASEIASVEQMRQQGGITRDYGTAIRQIDQSRAQVEQDYQTGSLKILESKQSAIAQANRDFQNKLLEIQAQRAQTEQAKAQAKLQALNDLRDKAYAAQQQALTYQQNLDMYYKQQQADLQTYAQKLQLAGQGSQNAINQFLGQTTTSPTSGLQTRSSNGQNTGMTGIMGPKKEDLTGQMTNSVQQVIGYDNKGRPIYDYVTPDKARAEGY